MSQRQVTELKPLYNADGKHTTTLIHGSIVRIHVHQDVLQHSEPTSGGVIDTNSVTYNKPIVDFHKLRPVGRLGGDTYTLVENGFDLKRPAVKVK